MFVPPKNVPDPLAPRPALSAPPRAVYIHVPFCAHRCGYCNFTLVAGRLDLADPYLSAIECELTGLGKPCKPQAVDTLFFGGGTPTQLPPAQLARLLALVLHWYPPAPGHEFSVEANPADVTAELIAVLAEHGVTRISLGAQSFQEKKLRTLERDHSPIDIERAARLVRRSGMQLALDLIFGVPGETLADWRADLDAALALAPDHVSTYGLTFERGTTFWNRLSHGQLFRAEEDLERSMYLEGIDLLTAAGLEHYEVSNFAGPGRRCRHNEAYWSGEPYAAAGPGATRYIAGIRETNHRSTTTYIKRIRAGQSPIAEREQLPPEDRARELLVFALRRIAGVDRRWFAERSGFTVDALVGPALRRYIDLGMLEDDGKTLRLTREGLLVSDAIWPEFLRR
ncbi:MAG TPA: radical SAM family heme chaperone HemW [Pirellulales bacterium]|jgi:oxygen-independent coproporphyrinogen-3 oxidase|nr:radical SAM family heme chaperone HemW [Pirellulales bacterium]